MKRQRMEAVYCLSACNSPYKAFKVTLKSALFIIAEVHCKKYVPDALLNILRTRSASELVVYNRINISDILPEQRILRFLRRNII